MPGKKGRPRPIVPAHGVPRPSTGAKGDQAPAGSGGKGKSAGTGGGGGKRPRVAAQSGGAQPPPKKHKPKGQPNAPHEQQQHDRGGDGGPPQPACEPKQKQQAGEKQRALPAAGHQAAEQKAAARRQQQQQQQPPPPPQQQQHRKQGKKRLHEQAGPSGASAAAAQAGIASAPAAAAKPWRPKQPAAVSSNWQALKQQLAEQAAAQPKRPRRRPDGAAGDGAAAAGGPKKQIGSTGHNKAVTPVLAMDCEMVGVGPGGERDSLARVSIVNASGNVLLDTFVAQKEPVADYRTWVSGVTAGLLAGAPALDEVQASVAKLLQGRTLVGHGLSKDLAVLMLSHPRKDIRDTARYPPFMFSKGGKRRPRALRHLSLQELGLSIQEGEHSSVDDARAALYLYQKHAAAWERALRTPGGLKALPTANRPGAAGAGTGKKKKKRVESYGARDVKDDPLADL